MSADRHPSDRAARDRANSKRKGLRIALAVAVGFTWSVLSGAIIPFLGPLFAAQFLISSSRPLPLKKALAMAVLILVAGALLQFVSVLTGDRPPVLLLLLGLLYFICFFLQANGKGGAAIFLILVVAVMVPLLTILNRDLGDSILSILVQGVVSGILLMWMAHAVIPDKGGTDLDAAAAPPAHPRAARYAAANTATLLIAVVACLTRDGLATAVVIPITVASLLSQFDVVSSARAAFGLVMVNLIGGLAASVAFAMLQVRPTPTFLFLVVLLAGLVFGGRAALRDPAAKLYAGALTIFLIVFGTGVSPLPASAAESFSTRVTYIFAAIAYTIFMATLLWPRPERGAEGRVVS